MSPIANVSDIVRMPRLGKIRLGIKVEPPDKSPYPKAVDYFVCPPEVQAVYGKEPKELDIMLPSEIPEHFAQQWLRRYSRSQGLICIGDGVFCRRKIDTQTGAIVTKDSKEWVWKEELDCNPQECPDYLKRLCRRIINLQVFLFNCPGLGVYQIDSSSFYSIVNINSMVAMLKAMLGRCSMLPLKLVLGPVEVTPPGENKKTVYVMHISSNVKLGELAKMSQLPPAQALLLPEPETAEPPEDFYPTEVLIQDEQEKAPPPGTEVVTPPPGTDDKKGKPKTDKPKDKGKKEPPPAVDPEATREEKKGIIDALSAKGITDQGQIRDFFISGTGKKGGWLHSDMVKLRNSLKEPSSQQKADAEAEADKLLAELGLTG
jgi:hypothetical protein